jgi:glutaredoxin
MPGKKTHVVKTKKDGEVFLKTIQKEPTLTLYHAEWCGHCQQFKSTWEKFISQSPCQTFSCEHSYLDCMPTGYQSVTGFPYIVLYYPKGSSIAKEEYLRERTVDGLQAFTNLYVEKYGGSKIKPKTKTTTAKKAIKAKK